MKQQHRKRRALWVSCAMIVGTVVLITGCSLTRVGYETATYQTTRSSDRFEIREYPALGLVSTPMDAGQQEADRGSFMRLFDYISGENEATEKIAMTTPVFMDDETMSFVLPENVAQQGAPGGTSPSVSLGNFEPGRYAVYRIPGGRSDGNIEAAKEALTDWLESNGLQGEGDYLIAGYDPPFIPPFFQRNEVLIRLKSE